MTDCRPPCDDGDRAAFATCVANGAGTCAAGNRGCCATEAVRCLGTLDDQSVSSTMMSCPVVVQVTEDACWPPCTSADEDEFFVCVDDGSSLCPPGDEDCCALSLDCLGPLGEDLEVIADGCCVDQFDCLSDEVCDPMTFECVPGTPGMVCGNELMEGTEECDDGNTITDSCEYGLMSCEVCAAGCVFGAGGVRFCGDGNVDPEEDCDPPGTICDSACQLPMAPTCGNGSLDGDETDTDCGGSCPPCLPGQGCEVTADCMSGSPLCPSLPRCDNEIFQCVEDALCDDSISCTADICLATGGCMSTLIDEDFDGFAPRTLGACGTDCDDMDRTVTPANTEDAHCDGVDEDCDDVIDERCFL